MMFYWRAIGPDHLEVFSMNSAAAHSHNARISRRIFLVQSASLVAGARAGLTHGDAAAVEADGALAAAGSLQANTVAKPRGAIYIPARAFNAYQMVWDNRPPIEHHPTSP